MAICEFFFNALKIDCFIKESKYLNICYNNLLTPLLLITFPFIKYCQDTCMLRLSSLELTFCLRDRSLQSAPLAVHCPPWDPKKIDKKDEVLLRASNFRKKLIPSFFPRQKKTSLQCRISVLQAVC